MHGGFSLPQGIMHYLEGGSGSFASLTPRGLGLACRRSGFEIGVSSDPCAHTLHVYCLSSPHHCQPLHFCLGCVPLEMPFLEDYLLRCLPTHSSSHKLSLFPAPDSRTHSFSSAGLLLLLALDLGRDVYPKFFQFLLQPG